MRPVNETIDYVIYKLYDIISIQTIEVKNTMYGINYFIYYQAAGY